MLSSANKFFVVVSSVSNSHRTDLLTGANGLLLRQTRGEPNWHGKAWYFKTKDQQVELINWNKTKFLWGDEDSKKLTFKQRKNGNCYQLAAMHSLFENESGREFLKKMVFFENDKIVIQFREGFFAKWTEELENEKECGALCDIQCYIDQNKRKGAVVDCDEAFEYLRKQEALRRWTKADIIQAYEQVRDFGRISISGQTAATVPSQWEFGEINKDKNQVTFTKKGVQSFMAYLEKAHFSRNACTYCMGVCCEGGLDRQTTYHHQYYAKTDAFAILAVTRVMSMFFRKNRKHNRKLQRFDTMKDLSTPDTHGDSSNRLTFMDVHNGKILEEMFDISVSMHVINTPRELEKLVKQYVGFPMTFGAHYGVEKSVRKYSVRDDDLHAWSISSYCNRTREITYINPHDSTKNQTFTFSGDKIVGAEDFHDCPFQLAVLSVKDAADE